MPSKPDYAWLNRSRVVVNNLTILIYSFLEICIISIFLNAFVFPEFIINPVEEND